MKIAIIIFLFLISVTVCVLLFGSSHVTKNLDNYIYDLPFRPGVKYKVVQGYGGLFSHKNKAAIDFAMPKGTPVYAARDGVIYSFKDDSNEGGPFPGYERKANYIIIQHVDGSFGCYWHLQKNGVVTKTGAVSKGQLIGYSGNTGFVLRPHLHFAVKRRLNYEKDSFVKTRFRTSNGIRFLEGGETYEKPLK